MKQQSCGKRSRSQSASLNFGNETKNTHGNMEMKTLYTILFILLLEGFHLHAEMYVFLPWRFASITIKSTKDTSLVTFEDYNKMSDVSTTLFKCPIHKKSTLVFSTPKGTTFTLKHLSEPVINDGNRRINSGDWQLTISGTSKEAKTVKGIYPSVAFGDTPPGVYLGAKMTPEEEAALCATTTLYDGAEKNRQPTRTNQPIKPTTRRASEPTPGGAVR